MSDPRQTLSRMLHRMRGERGSVLPLILASLMIALTATYVLVAATSLSIERKRLLTIADAVALSASESFSATDVSFSDGKFQPVLDSGRVEDRALATLKDLIAVSPGAVSLDSATTSDGVTAHVVLSGQWSPPLTHALLPAGVKITVSSDARVVLS